MYILLFFAGISNNAYTQQKTNNPLVLNNLKQPIIDNIQIKALRLDKIDESLSNIYTEREYLSLEKVENFKKKYYLNLFINTENIAFLADNYDQQKKLLVIFNRNGKHLRTVDLEDLGFKYSDIINMTSFEKEKSILLYNPHREYNAPEGLIIPSKVAVIYTLEEGTAQHIDLPEGIWEVEYEEKRKQWVTFKPTNREDKFVDHLITITDDKFASQKEFVYQGKNIEASNYLKEDILSIYNNEFQFAPSYTTTLYQLNETGAKLMLSASQPTTVPNNYKPNFFLSHNLGDNFWHFKTMGRNSYFSSMLNVVNKTSFVLLNRAPMSNFGDEYDFAFLPPATVTTQGQFAIILDLSKAEEFIAISEDKEDREKIAARYESLDYHESDIALMIASYSYDFLNRHAKSDFSPFLPPPSVNTAGNPVYDVELYPNPVTTGNKINYTISRSPIDTEKTNVTITLYSIYGGIIEQKQHELLSNTTVIEGSFNLEKISETVGFILIADERNRGVHKKFEIIR